MSNIYIVPMVADLESAVGGNIYTGRNYIAFCQDGRFIAEKVCSSDAWAREDFGINCTESVVNTFPASYHAKYKEFYPDGYVVSFLDFDNPTAYPLLVSYHELRGLRMKLPLSRRVNCAPIQGIVERLCCHNCGDGEMFFIEQSSSGNKYLCNACGCTEEIKDARFPLLRANGAEFLLS